MILGALSANNYGLWCGVVCSSQQLALFEVKVLAAERFEFPTARFAGWGCAGWIAMEHPSKPTRRYCIDGELLTCFCS